MKIEIDLNNILGDEFGSETLEESVRRQVAEALIAKMSAGMQKQIDLEISKTIKEQIDLHVKEKMPAIIEDVLSTEYVQCDRWGDRGVGPTTFRKELIKSINEKMVYKPTSYSSDKNVFTATVDDVIRAESAKFQKEFNSLVTTEFTKKVLVDALTTLKKTLGLA
jgi:hypothetical protein